MIKIDAKKKVIPVEIGSNSFEFDLSDDAVLKLHEASDSVARRIEAIEIADDLPEKERIKRTKQAQRESFDFLLGKGAYDKIYKEVCRVGSMTDILLDLYEQLVDEIEAANYTDKTKKYLGE